MKKLDLRASSQNVLAEIMMAEMPSSDTRAEMQSAPAQISLADPSTELWPGSAFLGLGFEDVRLDQMLMMRGPWLAPNFA